MRLTRDPCALGEIRGEVGRPVCYTPLDAPWGSCWVAYGGGGGFFARIFKEPPSLILFALTNTTTPWEGWIQVLKTSAATRRIPIAAFGPHVEHEPLERARAAGADLVLSRGGLHAP